LGKARLISRSKLAIELSCLLRRTLSVGWLSSSSSGERGRRLQPLEPASEPALVLLEQREPQHADQADDQQAAAEYRRREEVRVPGDLLPERDHAIIACWRARSRPK
jgi:hypothetical protein